VLLFPRRFVDVFDSLLLLPERVVLLRGRLEEGEEFELNCKQEVVERIQCFGLVSLLDTSS
jgi:hypothetical protein